MVSERQTSLLKKNLAININPYIAIVLQNSKIVAGIFRFIILILASIGNSHFY